MTATADHDALALPTSLRSHHEALLEALTRPHPGQWRDDWDFYQADQPEAIGTALVDALHTELRGARIGYLFREKMKTRDRVMLAKASKASGKVAHYGDLDLLIDVNWQAWRFLTREQRVALIDHELTHFARTENEQGETSYVMVSHDIEEFNSIVRRWGLWKNDVKLFAESIDAAPQLGLFPASSILDAMSEGPRTSRTIHDGDTTITVTGGERFVNSFAELAEERGITPKNH
jgi:hypothetical protein